VSSNKTSSFAIKKLVFSELIRNTNYVYIKVHAKDKKRLIAMIGEK
jgi:hypothetical protein